MAKIELSIVKHDGKQSHWPTIISPVVTCPSKHESDAMGPPNKKKEPVSHRRLDFVLFDIVGFHRRQVRIACQVHS